MLPTAAATILVVVLSSIASISCAPAVWAQCPSDQAADTGCPSGWLSYLTKCYQFNVYPLATYMNAKMDCNSKGAFLLRIDNADQENFIVSWLNANSVNRTMRWYTAGMMDPARFGDYIWDGYPTATRNFRTEVLQYFLDTLPIQLQSPTWPVDRKNVVIGSNTIKWGWFLDVGSEERAYICEADKLIVKQLLPNQRAADYGQYDVNAVNRGPCIVKQPEDRWFVPGMSVYTYVKFECEAYGYPAVTYNWYRLIKNVTSLTRILIRSMDDATGRISQTMGSLTIHNPDANKDSDQMQCAATNQFGTVLSRAVGIVFGQLENFEKQPRRTMYIDAYNGITIPCDAPHNSPPGNLLFSFYMIRDGKTEPVLSELRKNIFISQAKGLLGFSEVTTQDMGTYVCMISMKGDSNIVSDSRKSPDIPLVVREGNRPPQEPIIQDAFPNVSPAVPFIGNDVRLECFAYGYIMNQRMVYTWTKVNSNSLPAKAMVLDFGRTVLIPNVQPEDQGDYICRVADYRGVAGTPKSVTLRIQAQPTFVIAPTNQFVDFGSNATFTCEVFGLPAANHTWYINNKPLTDNAVDFNRYVVTAESVGRSTLTIGPLTLQDSTMIGCMGSNTLGTVAVYAELRVMQFVPNFIKYPLLPVEGMQGQNVIIECKPEGAPAPQLTWYFNNGKLTPALTTPDPNTGVLQCAGKYCVLPNGNLMVSSLVNADSGTYKCEATNNLGVAASSNYMTVAATLTFTLFPVNRVVQVNTTVDLPCRAVTAPHVDIDYAWYFEGVEIKFDRLDLDARRYEMTQFDRPYTRYFGTLRIRNIQFEYEGNYSCFIQTPIGRIQKWALLLVAGPPGPCAGVDVPLVLNTTSVPLRWTAGMNHQAAITYFVIEAQSFLNPNVWITVISNLSNTMGITVLFNNIDKGRRNYQLVGLAANMRYQVRVRAANKFGVGDPSPPSDWFTTLPQAPTKLVQNVTGGGGKRGTLVIRWQPLSAVDQNADGFYYTIQYRQKGQKDYQQTTSLTSSPRLVDDGKNLESTVTIGSKMDYLPFEVRVSAANSLGTGPFTEPVEVMSAAMVPTNAPRNVVAGAMNSTALTVSWTPPLTSPGEGPIIGYRIIYWKRNFDCRDQRSALDRFQTGARQTVFGAVTTGNVIGVDSDTYYCLAVQMMNTAGDGPESSYFEQTTYKRAPREFPTIVQVNSTGVPNEAHIGWVGVQPMPDEESVDGYRIRYWHAGAPFKETLQDVDVGLRNEGRVQGLSVNTRYNLRVYAYSRGGVGKMSSPMIQFMIIPKDQCIPGASWDGPDMRYMFICSGCHLSAMLLLALFPFVSYWLSRLWL